MEQGLLASKYKILRQIDVGGQAEVYLAIDQSLMRQVAIKRANMLLLDTDSRQRFLREAQILARVTHPHIITIHALEQENDHLYIVMSYADRGTLLDLIADSPAGLPIADVVELGIAVCQALVILHQSGVIHRDVKPGNILLVTESGQERPTPKLADFGMVRSLTSSESTTKGILGTLPYLPPEVIKGQERKVDERRDVYGVGAVLYEALTGRPPYGRGLGEILGQLDSAPLPPRQIREEVPIWLEEVVLKALAPDPDDRYSSMRPVLAALEAGKRSLQSRPLPGAEGTKTGDRRLLSRAPATGQGRAIASPLVARLQRAIARLTDSRRWRTLALVVPLIVVSVALGFALRSTLGGTTAGSTLPSPPVLHAPSPTPGSTGVTPAARTSTPTSTSTASPTPTDSPTSTATPTSTTTRTVTPTATGTATPTPTATTTPTPTATGTATPTPTSTATAAPTPTATRTPTPSPTPTPVQPTQQQPVQDSYKSPLTFRWEGSLGAGQFYQVVLYHPQSGQTIRSELLERVEWTVDLPSRQTGEWQWWVAVVQEGSEIATSARWVFWFDPWKDTSGRPTPTPADFSSSDRPALARGGG
jgi:serine/threonine-protein kinase